MSNVVELTDKNFAEETSDGKTVMIKFGAVWCQPCRMIAPVLDQVASEQLCMVAAVDIDNSPELTRKYNVRSVPTTVVLKDGVEVARHVGMATKEKLLNLLPKE